MSKAEQIYDEEFASRKGRRNECLRGRVLSCINTALEWAAEQCDRDLPLGRTHVFAERIRAGKAEEEATR